MAERHFDMILFVSGDTRNMPSEDDNQSADIDQDSVQQAPKKIHWEKAKISWITPKLPEIHHRLTVRGGGKRLAPCHAMKNVGMKEILRNQILDSQFMEMRLTQSVMYWESDNISAKFIFISLLNSIVLKPCASKDDPKPP